MNSILEQFYRLYFLDNIEDGITDEVYLLDKAKALKAKEGLLTKLSLEERGLFEDYLDASAIYLEGVTMAHFVAGARLGAKLAQELNLDLPGIIKG